MKNFIVLGLVVMLQFVAFGQDYSGFKIYTSKGKRSSVEKMFEATDKADFVFFGEYHNDPVAHWLQLELLKRTHVRTPGNLLMLSFEMFEQDQQELMDRYINGEIDTKTFEDSCRLWPNYETDYKPMIEYAKSEKIKVVAANIPRRYANLLYKKGREALDTLSDLEKSWIAPLDFVVDTTLSQYQEIKNMSAHMPGSHMLEAQAIKDATMAHFILKNRMTGQTVLHFNGAFHSDFDQGVIWYIEQSLGPVDRVTISTVSQTDISKLEKDYFGKADFIICVDEDMTKTH